MQLIEETYLGWDSLSHTVDCSNPSWDVAELRRDEGARPTATGAEPHACPNDVCSHSRTFGRVQVRLLCRDCGTVRVLTGEGLGEVCTHTSLTGWGQAPARHGDVWLWPGRPAIPGGAPHQYLVTRQPASLTAETLYGIITRYRDASGTPRWIAAAVPDEGGAHQVSTLRWRHSSNGLAAIEDAAAWITDAELPTERTLVVAV